MEKRPLFPIVWDAFVLVVAILAAFVIPARVVLEPAQQPLSLAMDAALTALFGIDLVLRLRWRRSAGGSRASNRWWLAVDILSALPLGRALGLGPAGLLRLIKTTYLFRYVGGWRRRTLLHPVAMRLGFFFFWMSRPPIGWHAGESTWEDPRPTWARTACIWVRSIGVSQR